MLQVKAHVCSFLAQAVSVLPVYARSYLCDVNASAGFGSIASICIVVSHKQGEMKKYLLASKADWR